LLAHGRWFSPGTPAASTTKTCRHDIAEILLKVALKHQEKNQIKSQKLTHFNGVTDMFVVNGQWSTNLTTLPSMPQFHS
jgi:hypothetical protein